MSLGIPIERDVNGDDKSDVPPLPSTSITPARLPSELDLCKNCLSAWLITLITPASKKKKKQGRKN
ncbi:hypothetical protein A2U01_0075140 [Trifolium medium]|uniref:Uncharacterized protein n=1 Tax=Trifolium medium TaxID=97028 RepID=A0A392SYI5_9FABA|nr:hypothetical protein [Trifolium medium]